MPQTKQEHHQHLHLETTAERALGKEINLVNKQDLNHLDLVIEAKNNRLKSEFFYIYDYDKFNDCSLLKPNFDILAAEAINHTSARYVVHYLTRELKIRLRQIDRKKASKQELNTFYDIFKPSLGQFNEDDLSLANDFIRSMFPYEGCSYTGEKLEAIITKSNWITLILSLRIIWSLLPEAIVPWDSFKKFTQYEESTNFTHIQSFYQRMPLFLPSHNHCCVLFEFLEIFITIFEDDHLLDLKNALDLVFTAGQICFNRDEFTESNENADDDLHELQKFYYKRGYSFHQIFVAYLRSLSKEPAFEHQSILDSFKINEYPPQQYKPVVQKALTLTVPSDIELQTTNYFKLISMAANATSRIYSSNHTFTKFENKFLDKFEVNPYKIIEHFFSKSSRNYLLKFDRTLDFDNFKVNDEVSELRKNLKDGTMFDNKEFVSTFISEFSRYGFESQRDNGNNASTFLADTINFNFNSKLQNVDSLPVRVSKLDISEWFINAWKYETFLGYLQNTVILKLTKTIGDCDWLIVTSHEKVSTTNRYLTPPSSTEVETDSTKDAELGGSLKDDDTELPSYSKRKSLLPAFQSKDTSPKQDKLSANPHGHPHASPLPIKRSPKKDLKRISFPSTPKDIAVFENEVHNNLNPSQDEKNEEMKKTPTKSRKSGKDHLKKKMFNTSEINKPLPPPMIPNQRITTPTQQVIEAMPTPPPMLQDSNNGDSLISHGSNFLSNAGFEIATPMTIKDLRKSPKLMKPSTPVAQANARSPLMKHTQGPESPAVHSRIPSTPERVGNAKEGPIIDSELVPQEKRAQYGLHSPVIPQPREKETDVLPQTIAIPQRKSKKDSLRMPDTPSSPVLATLARAPSSPHPVEESKPRAAHPYKMLRQSPPRTSVNASDAQLSASVSSSPPPPTSAPPVPTENRATLTPPTISTERFQTSPISPPTQAARGNRLSKLIVNTNNSVKSKITSPSSSPITQVLPKFFTRKSSQELASKMSSSESAGSLSHINDGSGTELNKKPSLLRSHPELKVSAESIPEIAYTPRALREYRAPSVSEQSATSSNNNSSELSRVISDNRESFVGNLSAQSRESIGCFDSDSELTQDTTKSISIHGDKASDHLDGLLEEIKESMDNEKFFSVDELSGEGSTKDSDQHTVIAAM